MSTATSTAEAKINFITLGLVDASWMRDIVVELLGRSNSVRPDLILVNGNQACLVNLDDSPYKPENRHLGNKFDWIREEILQGSSSMRYEPTNLVLANRFTKGLDCVKHLHFCKKIGLEDSEGSRLRRIKTSYNKNWICWRSRTTLKVLKENFGGSR